MTSLCCIGDSHVSNFTNMNTLLEARVWHVNGSIKSFNVGPFLAYNFHKKDRRDQITKLIKDRVEDNDYVTLSFGEIDARVHVAKQSKLQNRTIYSTIEEIIEYYFIFINDLKSNGFNDLVVSEIVPNRNRNKLKDSIKAIFNRKLEEKCKAESIHFLHIFNEVLPDNNFIDTLHLIPNKVFPRILERINSLK